MSERKKMFVMTRALIDCAKEEENEDTLNVQTFAGKFFLFRDINFHG